MLLGGLGGGRNRSVSRLLLQALLPFSFFISPSFKAHKSRRRTMMIPVKQCLFGETQQRVKTGRNWNTWPCLNVDLWCWGPPVTPHHGAACAPWCWRRNRLPAATVGPFPVVISSVQLWQISRPSSLFRHHPRQMQLTEKPVSLLLNKAEQGSCTLFSA